LGAERVDRRLAAILAADVVGYSRLMGQDDAGTLARLRVHRRDLIDPKVTEHKGRVVKTTGDGILIEFPSVVEAVACAVAVQQGMAERNAGTPERQRIAFRVGINLGDVIVEDGDIHGDGVNIAARLEGIAEPGEICVSAVVREQVEGRLNCAFDDLGEQALKNIARPIRVYRIGLGTRAAGPQAGETPTLRLPLPEKPSIAVLPFQNMSGDPEQDYFADGMVEEIITALSRIRWLFVIARNSSFTYKGQAIDVKQVGRELGVRYVLEGSVRKAAGRVRIAAQLVDAATGAHLWADRFDGSLDDVFDLQDKVAVSVAGVIEPTLRAAEISRSAKRPTHDLTAYDFYLRAASKLSSHETDRIAEALDLLGRAIERDPRYGPALESAARCHVYLHVIGRSEYAQANREGLKLVWRALQAARDDPNVLGNAAYVLGYFGEDIDAAIALIDRSLNLNPSFAVGWDRSGWLRLWAGQPDVAINHFETALRLNPRDPTPASVMGIGVGHFFARRFDESRAWLLRSLQEMPTWVPSHRFLAACYAQMGRLDEACEVVTQLRALTPVVTPSADHWRNPEQRELFLSGLRLAMG
jgi:adenylate cyclase